MTLDVAVLGGEVTVPTPKGTRVSLRVPPETQNETRLRLCGASACRGARRRPASGVLRHRHGAEPAARAVLVTLGEAVSEEEDPKSVFRGPRHDARGARRR